jgi:hypothetical protein
LRAGHYKVLPSENAPSMELVMAFFVLSLLLAIFISCFLLISVIYAFFFFSLYLLHFSPWLLRVFFLTSFLSDVRGLIILSGQLNIQRF